MQPNGVRTTAILAGLTLVFALAAWGATGSSRQQDLPDFEKPPFRYSASKPDDAIARLQKRIDSGATLRFDQARGYLDALLDELHVPASSQLLVYSKTSVQRKLISPATPRALYWTDGLYLGWIPGAPSLELAALDPRLGPIYYTLAQDGSRPPRFIRQSAECLQCHASVMTRNVPGHILRSVVTADDGTPVLSEQSFFTKDYSPWKERWGGWYVTGRTGAAHMGNRIYDFDKSANPPAADVSNLGDRLDTARYLRPTSDVVSLMLLDHQTHLENLIVRASYGVRTALAARRPGAEGAKQVELAIRASCEPLVRGLFLVDQPPLTAPVTGDPAFQADFQRIGPADPAGRSLRQLDLRRRLFRYPFSYTVYSRTFAALPAEVRQYVLRRVSAVLDGKGGAGFERLSATDRAVVRAILTPTLPGFASRSR